MSITSNVDLRPYTSFWGFFFCILNYSYAAPIGGGHDEPTKFHRVQATVKFTYSGGNILLRGRAYSESSTTWLGYFPR